MTAYNDSTHFVPYTPQYKKLKNGEIVSLALKMTHMKNNIINEICKYFAEGKQKDNNANEIQKRLRLHHLRELKYLTDKYALWLDFRTIGENTLHGTGRRIETASEGFTLETEKKAESTEKFKA